MHEVKLDTPGPMTLNDALRAYGEPAQVSEMLDLEEYDSPITILGGEETEEDKKKWRYRELRRMLQAALIEKLQRGVLIASGYDSRAPIDAPSAAIYAGRWRVLEPDFRDSSASAPGITISGILVWKAGLNVPAISVPPRTVPKLVVNRSAQSATLNGLKLTLSPRAFKLLYLLAEAADGDGHVVSRKEIEQTLWGNQSIGKTAAADAVRDLRQAVDAGAGLGSSEKSLIDTRHSVGYVLKLTAREIQIIS